MSIDKFQYCYDFTNPRFYHNNDIFLMLMSGFLTLTVCSVFGYLFLIWINKVDSTDKLKERQAAVQKEINARLIADLEPIPKSSIGQLSHTNTAPTKKTPTPTPTATATPTPTAPTKTAPTATATTIPTATATTVNITNSASATSEPDVAVKPSVSAMAISESSFIFEYIGDPSTITSFDIIQVDKNMHRFMKSTIENETWSTNDDQPIEKKVLLSSAQDLIFYL